MKTLYCVLLLLLVSCQSPADKPTTPTPNYEIQAADTTKAVLILFPCYPCNINHTKTEASFLPNLKQGGVTTILMNTNKKLYLNNDEKQELYAELQSIFTSNHLPNNKIFIGGFSSGGNIALLIADYISSVGTPLNISGVFAVDAPIDLEQLYCNAQNDVLLDANLDAKSEGLFLVNLLETELGTPAYNLQKYITYAPYLISQNSTQNLKNHLKYKIRLYTEPAPEWQMQSRKRTLEYTNSYMLENLYHTLKAQHNQTCELIKTQNRGQRADGATHPHSWSIVEANDLLRWIVN